MKHSFLVLDVDDIAKTIFSAYKLASEGRPGPVVVDIPKNIQQQKTIPVFPAEVKVKTCPSPLTVKASDIEAIRRAIRKAERPCVYAGGGVIASGASGELEKFAGAFNIPVTTTLMGLGAMPESNPLSLRWLGMHGSYCANYAANEADLLLAFGVRFDDRVTGATETFAPDAYIIHVDVDISEINKNKHADLGVIANVRDVLAALNKTPFRRERRDWFARIEAWKKAHPFLCPESKGREAPKPQQVIRRLYELTKGEAVIVPGVGQHQMWAAQFYEYKYPRQFLTSGGLGSMGFGLPAALGAKIACPGKTVINIDGDGSFQMNIQELGTLHAENVALKMVILNNQRLGMVAQWEDRFYGGRRGNTVLEGRNHCYHPDFVKIAEGFGVPGRLVERADELDSALKEMLAADGPFLVDCHTGYAGHVLPMIPPGGSYRDIILE